MLTNDVISFRNKSGIVPPACKVYKSVSTSITSGSPITFDLETFDTDTMHSTVTNTDRITINTAGIYIVTFGYLINYAGTLTKEQPTIYKNGSATNYVIKYGSGTTNMAHVMHTILSLSATDYLQALITITGATSPATDVTAEATYFSAIMLGATS